MNMLGEFLRGWLTNHKLIVAPLTACGVTQLIKGVYMYLKERCWRWYWLFSDGGMPSAHSAMVVALVAGIGFTLGYNSDEFALALVFALIVLHDAMGVRRVAGKHSQILRQIVEKTEGADRPTDIPPYPVGHDPKEVLAGAVIGVVVAGLVFAKAPAAWQLARHIGRMPFHYHIGL